MLEEAKANCDYLIVCLQTDPTLDRPNKNKPVQSVYERYVQLKGCKFVDEIIPYSTEDEVKEILMSRLPNIRFIGEEYKLIDFTGKDLCKFLDIEIFYNKRQHSYSTSELRKKIEELGCKS